jgi:hypothetical protein
MRPPELEWRVFRGTDAVGRGLVTPHQLRSSAWVRVRHDVYADARLSHSHTLACRAALLRVPDTAVIAGPSAAALWGVRHAAGPGDDVHVLVPLGSRLSRRRGLRVHRTDLFPGEVVRGRGPARTGPLRTAWDVAAWLDPVAAVSILSGLLAAGVVTADGLRAEVARRRGDRGWRRVAAAVAAVTPRVVSARAGRSRRLGGRAPGAVGRVAAHPP